VLHETGTLLAYAQAKLGRLAEVPTLSLFGGSDEYMSETIDPQEMRDKFAAVLTHPLSQARVVDGADHALDGHEEEATNFMIRFIQTLSC